MLLINWKIPCENSLVPCILRIVALKKNPDEEFLDDLNIYNQSKYYFWYNNSAKLLD